MERKSIRIDTEAYERLLAVKREGESLSQTIKRVVRPSMDPEAYGRKLRRLVVERQGATP